MTRSIHPLEATERIRQDYIRYLQTTFFLRDETLRGQFQTALAQPDFLVRGPLLEASPPFRTGRSIEHLIRDGVLHPDFDKLASALPPRELYLHQDRAIEQVVRQRRNVVVATGTGSGKTESFLIPILDSLLRERAAGQLTPGVRALLLYPMNALANDQLKRLRGLLGNLSDITFGRYTGETRETEREALAQFQEQFHAEPPPNETISRERMREKPPHLLITNYAMLEYLLLRPQDSEFFDGSTGRSWRFLVLDEAHIYDGATGIEIAMLLRRLKDRVVGGERGRLTCLATSATLGKGAELLPAIATFAETLFDEPFATQDIIEGEREPLAQNGTSWAGGTSAFYNGLEAALRQNAAPAELRALCQTVPAPRDVVSEALAHLQQSVEASDGQNRFLHTLLRGDARLHRLRDELREPRRLAELAHLWGEGKEAEDALIALVRLAVRARPTPDSLSLLPARYHLFARSLEGAFLCLNGSHPAHQSQGKPRLFLHRHERCPHCTMAVFELATCPRCGIGYLVGREERQRDQSLLRHLTGLGEQATADLCYLLLGEATEEADEDESLTEDGAAEESGLDSLDTCHLCLGCGAMDSRCDCGTPTQNFHRLTPKRGSQGLQRCAACGTRSRPISRFLTGRDAPVSVVATSLYQLLPPADDKASAELSGGGRKLLAFADSRQDAAFFAPYLENTYGKILQRRLLAQVLLTDEAAVRGERRLQDLVEPLRRAAEAAGLFSIEEGGIERKKIVSLWLMRELTALDARMGLEGLGFLRFRLVKPPGWEPPTPLLAAPWNLTPDEAWALVESLLTTLRQQAIVTFPDEVPSDDPIFAPRKGDFYLRDFSAKGKARVLGWLPKQQQGSNRRLDFLMRLLRRSQPTWGDADIRQHAYTLLRGLWEHLRQPLWHTHLPSEQPKALGLVAYRLNHKLWEWVPVPQTHDPIYRCDRCFAVSYHFLRGTCPTNGCDGTLVTLSTEGQAWGEHHYRQLYQTLDPFPLAAEEHTAQWTASEASSIQSRFIRGEVNVLSCSTTFELGVDVGDLQAVLLRNMPPTTANYLQRAGRAGRRTDSVAFVLTFAQRRSHDLTYFAQPERMVSGHVPPPVLTIQNEKIVRRHVHAVAMASFFRWIKGREERLFGTVGAFFAPPEGVASGPVLLQEYLRLPHHALRETLRRVVPSALQEEIGVETDAWHAGLMDETEKGVLDKANAEVRQDLALYARLEMEAKDAGKYKQAEYFQRVAETVRGRNLLGFLGSRNVLPKYGFPTDVVELRTGHIPDKRAQQVELQRDLQMAISEYAPDGEVVAAKLVWKSRGLYQMAGRSWETIAYAICQHCQRFHLSKAGALTHACEGCGEPLAQSKQKTFIIPEFGFVADRTVTPSGERRPQRLYASQIYFSEYQGAPPPWIPVAGLGNDFVGVSERHARHGLLSLVNSGFNGAGFHICPACGWARAVRSSDRSAPKKHDNPRTDQPCSGKPGRPCDLGHTFLTDVIELRFDGLRLSANERAAWLSVLYALLEGASEALGVARDDLEGTLHRSHHTFSLVLFDKVPGGAGHVVRLREAKTLRAALEAARRRVARCECGEETSCYECLRTFYNQHAHDLLSRGLALRFLDAVLGEET